MKGHTKRYNRRAIIECAVTSAAITAFFAMCISVVIKDFGTAITSLPIFMVCSMISAVYYNEPMPMPGGFPIKEDEIKSPKKDNVRTYALYTFILIGIMITIIGIIIDSDALSVCGEIILTPLIIFIIVDDMNNRPPGNPPRGQHPATYSMLRGW